MNGRRCFLFVLFLLLITVLLPADDDAEEYEIVEATGIVRLVKSGPSSQLVITGSRVQWHIAKEDESKLHNLQQKTVTVEGEERVIELKAAHRTMIRRELRNIRIIAIED